MKKPFAISGAILMLFLLLSIAGCSTDKAGRIVFLGPVEGQNAKDIYSMNPDGSDRVKLAQWSTRWIPY